MIHGSVKELDLSLAHRKRERKMPPLSVREGERLQVFQAFKLPNQTRRRKGGRFLGIKMKGRKWFYILLECGFCTTCQKIHMNFTIGLAAFVLHLPNKETSPALVVLAWVSL